MTEYLIPQTNLTFSSSQTDMPARLPISDTFAPHPRISMRIQ